MHEVDRGATMFQYCGGWANPPLVEGDSTAYDSEKNLYEKSLESLVDIIQSAQNKDIVVVGILFPQNPAYQNTGAYGRYGLRRSAAEQLISRFVELEKNYPNFKFLDRNRMGNHCAFTNINHEEDCNMKRCDRMPLTFASDYRDCSIFMK